MERNTHLVLGANGMLGSMVCTTFAARGLQVKRTDQTELDITDRDAVFAYFHEHKPVACINCAAYTNVDGAETDEAVATRINAEAVQHVADAAKATQTRLVHISTDYVFDGTNSSGYAEDAPSQPLSAYGRSKAAGERALQSSGADWLLVRTAWLYGPNGKNFVDTIRTKLEAGEELRVVGDQIGSPTFTADLAAAVADLLTAKVPSGIFHLVNSGQTSWYGLACAIRDILGYSNAITEVTTAAFPRPAARPAYSILLNTKRPPLPQWQDALTRYLQRT